MNIWRLKEVAKKNHQLAVQGATYMLILLKEPDWEISASEICHPTFEGLSLSSLIAIMVKVNGSTGNCFPYQTTLVLKFHSFR
jgi:hypothetical protein